MNFLFKLLKESLKITSNQQKILLKDYTKLNI